MNQISQHHPCLPSIDMNMRYSDQCFHETVAPPKSGLSMGTRRKRSTSSENIFTKRGQKSRNNKRCMQAKDISGCFQTVHKSHVVSTTQPYMSRITGEGKCPSGSQMKKDLICVNPESSTTSLKRTEFDWKSFICFCLISPLIKCEHLTNPQMCWRRGDTLNVTHFLDFLLEFYSFSFNKTTEIHNPFHTVGNISETVIVKDQYFLQKKNC